MILYNNMKQFSSAVIFFCQTFLVISLVDSSRLVLMRRLH